MGSGDETDMKTVHKLHRDSEPRENRASAAVLIVPVRGFMHMKLV